MAVVQRRGIGLRDDELVLLRSRGEQWKRVTYFARHTGFVDDFVDVVGGDAGLDFAGRDIEDFARESADFAHAFLFLLVQHLDLVAQRELSSIVSRLRSTVLSKAGDTPARSWVYHCPHSPAF